MGLETAQSLLTCMLALLPTRIWWMFLERKTDDVGLAKAFSIPHADIEALLGSTGLYNKTGKGTLFFVPGIWAIY